MDPALDHALATLAASQHGVFSHAQARQLGFSYSAINHRVVAHRWIEVHARLFRVAGAPATPQSIVMATVLSAGRDAVATAETALALHAVRDSSLLPARVVVGRRPHPRARAGVSETFLLPESHRTAVDGIPTATVARALFDLAGLVGERRLARAVDSALAGRKVTVTELAGVVDELAERGRKGSVALRTLLGERGADYRAPTTALEHRFAELVADHGLPDPERQASLGGITGWIGTVDFLWRSPRVVVETDGSEFHDSVTDRENDERRDRALEAAGWTVLRFNWNDVTKRPTSVVRTVRRALAA